MSNEPAELTPEDIGEFDLDGDGIPDDLDVEDLDDLVAAVDPDDIDDVEDDDVVE